MSMPVERVDPVLSVDAVAEEATPPPRPESPTEEPARAPQAGSPAEEPTRRRHRVLFWAALLAALAVAVGGGRYALATYQTQIAPETVVSDYLAAVARGDAAGALAYGDLPAGEHGMLTADVLAAQRDIARISGITVQVDAPPGDVATARVRYELGFESGQAVVADEIPLVRDGRTWRLAAVAVPVTIRVLNASGRATVAGADVPQGSQLVFPGALPLSFDTENLMLDDVSRIVRFAQADTLNETAELSAAGEDAVRAAFDAAIDSCLDGTSPEPTLCPLPSDPRAVPGSLRGTTDEPASAAVVVSTQPGNDGLVRIVGELTITGEYQQLDFNNQQVTKAGEFSISVLAACYAPAPESIVWRGT